MIDWEKVALAFMDENTVTILETVAIRTDKGELTTPKWMSEFLDLSLPLVSYHFRKLRDKGVIEEVPTEQKGSAVQHFYRVSGSYSTNSRGSSPG